MKATNSMKIPSQAAGFLKLAGVVLFLVSLVNLVLLFIPPQFGDVQWQVEFTTQMVQQGIVPILAIALMFCAYGLEEVAGIASENTKVGFKTLKFWVYIIAAILGVFYLLLIPLHISSVAAANSQTLEKINQDATKAKEQVAERLQQQQTQMSSLLQDNQKLEEYVISEQLTQEQVTKLEEFKKNPDALKRQASAIGDQLKRDIEERRKTAEKRSNLGSFKSNVRTGLSSLLLASCYLTIGWNGLQGGKYRKKTRRASS